MVILYGTLCYEAFNTCCFCAKRRYILFLNIEEIMNKFVEKDIMVVLSGFFLYVLMCNDLLFAGGGRSCRPGLCLFVKTSFVIAL